jgi:hypothetical protein
MRATEIGVQSLWPGPDVCSDSISYAARRSGEVIRRAPESGSSLRDFTPGPHAKEVRQRIFQMKPGRIYDATRQRDNVRMRGFRGPKVGTPRSRGMLLDDTLTAVRWRLTACYRRVLRESKCSLLLVVALSPLQSAPDPKDEPCSHPGP